MNEPHETRIVRDTRTGKLSLVHPASDRVVPTGLKAAADTAAADQQVRQVKAALERAGNRVSYREV